MQSGASYEVTADKNRGLSWGGDTEKKNRLTPLRV